MTTKRATGRVLPAAVLAAVAVTSMPASAEATCSDIVNCVANCPDDRCTRACARYGDATAQALFSAALQCLDTYCPYDSSDACASRNCSYQISQCGADGGGGYAPTGYAPTSYDPGYSGIVADGDIDNFTFKFGGGYVFSGLDGGLLDMTMGWEHLWVIGPAESASTVQLGLDVLFEMFSASETILAVGGAADVKYYFGTNILEELPWFTFGLGAMLGGGTTFGGWDTEDMAFLVAAPEISLQWIYPFGGGFDFYGGAIFLFGGSEDVAPFVGMRGVMDITLFASNI